MQRIFKVAILLSIIPMLLTSLSFKTAEARTSVSRCQLCQGHFIPQSGSPAFKYLYGVATVSANDIWAVGSSSKGNPSPSQTLTEHWNGTQWSIAKSPSPGANYNILSGVAAITASNIWAVGEFVGGNTGPTTLIEHWNGTQWSVVKSPGPGARGSFLSGVAAVSANNVWAVGGSYTNTASPTLIEHWNGTQWSIIKSPATENHRSLN